MKRSVVSAWANDIFPFTCSPPRYGVQVEYQGGVLRFWGVKSLKLLKRLENHKISSSIHMSMFSFDLFGL